MNNEEWAERLIKNVPVKPYYAKDGILIWNCDCREVLPFIGEFDLCLTDPPYGIGKIWVGGSEKHGWGRSNSMKDTRNTWDAAPADIGVINHAIDISKSSIIWGGNYFPLPPSRCWLVWNKPERGFSLAEAELAWTNQDAVVRVWDCRRSDPDREHPTQKPLDLMKWCLMRHPSAQTILDPFMGSGTTLVAAKQLGRRAVGIEIERAYCDIAIERLSQGVFSFDETHEAPDDGGYRALF